MTAREYTDYHNQLMQMWINEYQAGDGKVPFAIDGVLDPENWFSQENQEERVLFVLREAYDTGEDLPSYIDCSHLPSRKPYPRVWNLSNYLYGRECTALCSKKSIENCSTCRKFKGTYGNCAAWMYAIEQDTDTPRYTHFQAYCDENQGARVALLRKTAVINIKKPNGKNPSNFRDLMFYAKNDAEKLREQIKLINPTLIICGGTFEFFEHLYPDMPRLLPCKNHPDNEKYGYTTYDQRKIISMPHPAGCQWYPAHVMYEDIVANYKELQKYYPAPTKDRYGNPLK